MASFVVFMVPESSHNQLFWGCLSWIGMHSTCHWLVILDVFSTFHSPFSCFMAFLAKAMLGSTFRPVLPLLKDSHCDTLCHDAKCMHRFSVYIAS